MSSKPKPDAQLTTAVNRLRGTPDVRRLRDFLQAMVEYDMELLVTANPESMRVLQGRIGAIREISEMIKEK